MRERFSRDDLSKPGESADNAIFLGCDELQIGTTPWEGHLRDALQLLAVGKIARVELEGKLFQANSDTLSYDESNQLITLRGLGVSKASLSHQQSLGAPYSDATAQTIRFNPARRSVSVEGAGGLFGSP
jgi:hypothetical protein